eukprot:359586-Chlamydomonas_euryale.AAC.17
MANNGPGSGPGPAYSGGPEHGGPPPRGGYRDGPPPPYRDGPPPQGYRDAPPPPRERGGMYGGPPLAPPRGPPGGPAPYDAYDVGPPAAYRPGPGGPGPYDPYGPSDPYPPPRNGMPPMVALPAAHMGPSAAMHGHGDLLSPYAGGPAALQPLVPVPVPGQYVPAPVAPPAAMPGYPQQPPVSGRRSYAVDQATMGIRVTELHGMSVFAEYVHPAPALKLQQLWDGLGGAPNRLVSLLDDRSWEVLSDLAAPEALAVIDQVAEAMSRQELRNPNAFFMCVAMGSCRCHAWPPCAYWHRAIGKASGLVAGRGEKGCQEARSRQASGLVAERGEQGCQGRGGEVKASKRLAAGRGEKGCQEARSRQARGLAAGRGSKRWSRVGCRVAVPGVCASRCQGVLGPHLFAAWRSRLCRMPTLPRPPLHATQVMC